MTLEELSRRQALVGWHDACTQSVWIVFHLAAASLMDATPATPTPQAPMPEPSTTPPTTEPTDAPVAVDETSSIDELEAQWTSLNAECQGGSHTPDDTVCSGRDRVEEVLRKRSVCWAYSDENVPPAAYKWHNCAEATPTPN